MALRIKELLYEDQYTIAGAKKKLSAELRGASKLKVVTSEMTAPQPQAVPPPASPPPTAAPVATQSFVTESAPAIEPRPQRETALQTERAALTADQRTAVRHLAHQLLDLLSTLDAGEADIRPQGK
jgi:hypothetical protein